MKSNGLTLHQIRKSVVNLFADGSSFRRHKECLEEQFDDTAVEGMHWVNDKTFDHAKSRDCAQCGSLDNVTFVLWKHGNSNFFWEIHFWHSYLKVTPGILKQSPFLGLVMRL